MWRKNLRDNNGDGVITPIDGVDPNRNFPTKWGYDNEGSSPNFGSDLLGRRPGSEPETLALDGLMDRIGFRFQVNYHWRPSCCCGARAGRCRPPRPTTPSTRP